MWSALQKVHALSNGGTAPYVPHLAHLTNADRQLLAFGLDSSQDSRALKLSHKCASICQMGDS